MDTVDRVDAIFEKIGETKTTPAEAGYIGIALNEDFTMNDLYNAMCAILEKRGDALNSINRLEQYLETEEGVQLSTLKRYDPKRASNILAGFRLG